MYKKVYLEITNVCNLNCSFCHKTKRDKKFMSEEEFIFLATKIRPFTDYLYFHLMGEPMLHPQFGLFLKKANDMGFKTTVATNGLLIKEKAETLLASPPYKITFSLHSFEANSMLVTLNTYLNNIMDFCKKAEKKGCLCVLRLWNNGGENRLNDEITDILQQNFVFKKNRSGFTLSEKIFLEYADRFTWPDLNEKEQNVTFCMGLRDHFGVLCDGSVVPCCLDADGTLTLGNLFDTSLDAILSSEKAEEIRKGFSNGHCTQELCRKCQYATRFNK